MVFGSDDFGSLRRVIAWRVKTAKAPSASYLQVPLYRPMGRGCENELPYRFLIRTSITSCSLW